MSGNRILSVVLATMLVLSVFSAAFAGSAVADSVSGDDYDAELTDNGLYWQGQTLNYTDTTNLSDGDTVILRKVTDSGDEFKSQYSANSSSTVLVNTDDREGSYYLETNDGTKLVSFEVAEQTMTAEVDNATVYNQDDVDSNTANFTVDSNRAAYDIVVNATDLDIEDLKEVFADESYDIRTDADGDDYFAVNVTGNERTLNGNFSKVSNGDYTFTFKVEDTGISKSVDVSVADPGDKSASFDQSVYSETAGDVFEFTVDLQNTDTATLVFGDEKNSGYEHSVDVSNAEGEVTLRFNTLEAGDGDAESPWSLPSDSDATITPGNDETDLTDALAPGYNYGISVQVDGLEKDLATLELQERNTESVSIHTLPGSSPAELSDIRANATPTDEVASGDYLIAQVSASGVYANLDNDTTGADLENGSTFATENGYEVNIVDEDAGLNQPPKQYDVSAAQDVIVDAENDTFFLVYDTADLDYESGDSPTVHFNMTQDNPYITSEEEATEQSASTEFEFVKRTFEYNNLNDENVVEVPTMDNVEVGGTTSAAPGTETTINLRSESGADVPFTMSKDATVDEDGSVTATFNMSEYAEGTNFTVTVRDFAPDRQDAVLVSNGPSEYDVSFNVVDADGNAVQNASVSLNGDTHTTDENGTVTATVTEGEYTATISADGYTMTTETVNVSDDTTVDVELMEAPTEYDYTVEVVDQDDNAVSSAMVMVNGETYEVSDDGTVSLSLTEGEYTFEASADGYEGVTQAVSVSADGSVTLSVTEEMTTTTTPSDNTTTSEPTNTTTPSDDDNNSSGGSVPGFGVGIALVAIIGAALLAYRQA